MRGASQSRLVPRQHWSSSAPGLAGGSPHMAATVSNASVDSHNCFPTNSAMQTAFHPPILITVPGRLMVRGGERKACVGVGQSGSFSPVAAAQMNMRVRDCGTP